eukprot:m51a1_g7419 hypothetical protein (213) ;mRNA; r:231050-231688
MLSGVVWLLPGLLINKSVADLATNNMVSGTAHILYAMLAVFELAFGLSLGFRASNQSPADAAETAHGASLPVSPWFDLVWTPVAACGAAVLLGAAPAQLPAITVSGALASLVQVLGDVLGAELATMVAEAVIVLTGNVYERVYERPAFVATCVGSLLLVPASLGARGAAAAMLVGDHVALSMQFTSAVAVTLVCMVAGGFVANMVLYRNKPL